MPVRDTGRDIKDILLTKFRFECILNEKFDDLKGFFLEEERISMERFAEDLLKFIAESAKRLLAQVRQAKVTMDRKNFAAYHANGINGIFSLVDILSFKRRKAIFVADFCTFG